MSVASFKPVGGAPGTATRAALLTQLQTICRSAHADGSAARSALATGYRELDAVLPGGGWPPAAITELMPEAAGIGELSLLLPALATLAARGRYLAWIAPPYVPYAPALTGHGIPLERLLLIRTANDDTALWAAEQLLRCAHIGAVLAWPLTLDERRVRRLQLAAEAGGGCGMLYRPPRAALTHSAAALRLGLTATHAGLCVHIKKSRGGYARAVVVPALAATAR
jgi:cell division inhibitor SulA/protein ImuA